MPDVALFVSIVVLFYCLFFYGGTEQLFRDSDTGWHIRNGESILATGHIPHADPYSFTKAGEPWYPWEWGADVLMGFIHQRFSLSGIALLYASCIALATWLWFKLNWRLNGNFFLACVLAAPMLSTSNLHWLARPHIFSWVFLLLLLLRFENASGPLRARAAIQLAALSAVWANVHGSFFLGPVIAMVYAAGWLARTLIWRAQGLDQARWFALAAASLAAGSLINPFGLALHTHVFSYLNDHELIQRIAEFQSFNFHVEGATQILLALGISAVGGILALQQRRPHWFLLAAMFSVLAIRSARGLPLVAILLLPFANATITSAITNAVGLRPWLRRALDTFFRYSRNVRAHDARFHGLALVPCTLALAFIILHAPAVRAKTGFPPTEFPVAAAAELEKLPENARLLAPDKFGGYLIYRFRGQRKVFFDGRSDFYGSTFMKEYIKLVEVRPGWQSILAKWHFTHALLPNTYSLVPALEQEGWKRLYSDATVTLLRRN